MAKGISSHGKSKTRQSASAATPLVKPVQTCPSFRAGHLPADDDVIRLRQLTAPHVESFNYFLEEGLAAGIRDMEYGELDLIDYKTQLKDDGTYKGLEDTTTVRFWVENVSIHQPTKTTQSKSTSFRLLPRECRERGLMYSGRIHGTFCYQIVERRNGMELPHKVVKLQKQFGDMPIMVLSKACHLHGKMPAQLVQLREEDNEFGGYFIVNGIERCIRMLQIPRRNHATAIQRSSYKNRGPTYTDLGIAMRCSRGDQSSITNTVHYLTTGGANLKFVARKQEFLIPVILLLRALSGGTSRATTTTMGDPHGADRAAGGTMLLPPRQGLTDEELYRRIVQGDDRNTFLVARAALLLQDARARFGRLHTPDECLAFLGMRFRRLGQRAETTSDVDVGHYMIRNYVLVHLPKYEDKLDCLLFLMRKLYSFAAGDCGVDNADSLQNQEILLPGHLMCAFVKEKFEEFLASLRTGLMGLLRRDYASTVSKMTKEVFWSAQVDRFSMKSSGGIGKKVAYLLSTGNIVSTSGLDLMQV